MRIKILRSFLAVGMWLGLGVSIVGAEEDEKARPNVVFILADDLGWADTTLYGQTKFHRTPHLERLAKRGMTFTRAYAASPLCSPTRSSILTGLSPARTGITTPNCHLAEVVLEATPGKKGPRGNKAVGPVPPTRMKTEYVTLAETLREAGYKTGHFGKWHLGRAPYSPLEQGFDVDVPHWPGPGPAGSYVAPWKFPDFDADAPGEHIEDRMAREAVAFMEENRGGPFFLNYWMFSVHAPFDAKRELVEEYRGRVDSADAQRSPTYAAMVESMDDAVGTLLDALDRLGLAENTVVVFFSDNGGNGYSAVDGVAPTSNRPLRGGKATVFEGGVRVPCTVTWPGVVEPGTRSAEVVQSSDFYPTLLEILGIAARPGQIFDGVSMVPALKGLKMGREAIFTYFPHDPGVADWLPPAVSVHRGDWKLIRLFHQGEGGAHRYLLFHLAEDVGETKNRAEDEPELVEELDGLIEGYLEKTGAVRPVPNPDFDPAVYRPELEGKQTVKEGKKEAAGRVSAGAKPAGGADGDGEDPALQGWKARQCSAEVRGGIVTVKGIGEAPFLGVGAAASGPGKVFMRVRCAEGGEGKVEWLKGVATGEAVGFALKGGDWEDVEVAVPAEGALGILRIYVPAQGQAVEIDAIELRHAAGTRRWEF